MTLYEQWLKNAYDKEGDSLEKYWDIYMPKEQKIYEYILDNKITNFSSSVKELSEKYDMLPEHVCGFLDGINEALDADQKMDMKKIKETSKVQFTINFEKLYKKMVEFKADTLYTLPNWNNIFTDEQKEELYSAQKSSRTVVKDSKIGRNEPCPCGSGKKYKHCCGK